MKRIAFAMTLLAGALMMVSSVPAVGAGTAPAAVTASAALTDVVSISSSDAWAVGDGGIATHWDGASWTSRHLGGPSSPNLNGIDATSSSNVWAVGGVIFQDAFRGFASHWDGGGWHRTPVPAYPGETTLEDVTVTSSTNAYAVGRWFATTPAGHSSGAVIIHWNGVAWRRSAVPNSVASLVAITSVRATDHLAAGRRKGTGDPVVVRITPVSRVVIPLPTPLAPPQPFPPASYTAPRCVAQDIDTSPVVVVGACWSGTPPQRRSHPYVVERHSGLWTLTKLSGSANLWGVGTGPATWAVGRSPAQGQPVTLRRRPNGTWFRVASPSLPRGGLLNAVDVRTFNDAWSVGWRRVGTSQRPLALRWDGASWTAVVVPLA